MQPQFLVISRYKGSLYYTYVDAASAEAAKKKAQRSWRLREMYVAVYTKVQ